MEKNNKNEQFIGIELPAKIADKLREEALKQSVLQKKRVFMRDVVEKALCEHLGIKYKERRVG